MLQGSEKPHGHVLMRSVGPGEQDICIRMLQQPWGTVFMHLCYSVLFLRAIRADILRCISTLDEQNVSVLHSLAPCGNRMYADSCAAATLGSGIDTFVPSPVHLVSNLHIFSPSAAP